MATLMLFQGVAPKDSPAEGAPAQSAGGGGGPAGSPLISFFPLLILLPLFFMMFRKQKKEQEARGKLKKGDRVVTQAGLIGELQEMDERIAKVKIAPGTTVQVLANTVSALETPKEKTEPATPAEAKK
jgi:preprotein translocase subunit YajC